MATTPQLRQWWQRYECEEGLLKRISFAGDQIRIAPETEDAWKALETVILAHSYTVRTGDTASYNCRNISGTNNKSLHSYGIALDINWNTNPWIDHPGVRQVRFSNKSTQQARSQDVLDGIADTDMTAGMIGDILSIRTNGGLRVFEWGGSWNGVKDSMHFEIDVAPSHLAEGINHSSVNDAPVGAPSNTGGPVVHGENTYRVTARSGLRLRSGPSTDFDILEVIEFGRTVRRLGVNGDWFMVSLRNDDRADGHMHSAFLAHVDAHSTNPESDVRPETSGNENVRLSSIEADDIWSIFHPSAKSNISRHWGAVKSGLVHFDLFDEEMLAMALGTIKAETAGFVPISEGQSQYNTLHSPFDLYDAGTSKGADLGNTQAGDGPRFKGRGFIQLTGRYNYANIGALIDEDLVGHPELANDPEIAGLILSRFLKNKEDLIRTVLQPTSENLKKARRYVNGGSHGLSRFKEAYRASRAKFG